MEDLNALTREQLIQMVEQLLARIAELEGKSGNPPAGGSGTTAASAKPLPSWVKPNRARRQSNEPKKRPHGFARQKQTQPTRVVEHAAQNCPDCNRTLTGGTVHRTREIIDIPEAPVEIVHHRILARHCGVCNKRVLSPPDLSHEAVGRCRFGVRLMGLVAHLHTIGRMAHRQIQQLLKAQYGLSLSTGAIAEILHTVARQGKACYDTLLTQVRNSPFAHSDETGWREDGQNGYLWALATPAVRLFSRSASRGSAVIQRLLGEAFRGVLVTDFYSAYHGYLGEHQWCWVHYLRDLKKLEEEQAADPAITGFVAQVKQIYSDAKDLPPEPDARKRLKRRAAFQDRLAGLCEPLSQRAGPACTLARRGRDRASGLFTFLEYPDVPSHNNAAEQAVRPCVIQRKTSGGTRSARGSETMAVLLTLFGTWGLRGLNPLEQVQLVLRSPQAAATLL